jgi:hypothetical protein
MKSRGVVAAALVAAFALAMASPAATAQSGIGVWNVPPTFSDVRVGLSGDYVVVNVTIYDPNSGIDIYSLNVLVVDGEGDVVANVSYFQHSANTTTDVNDRFVDNYGGHLIAARCDVDRFVGNFIQNNTVRVTFVMGQFQGKTIRIIALDNPGDSAFYEGPFSSEYRPPPLIEAKYQIYLIAVSLLASAGGSMVFVYRRVLSNRLARKIENIERSASEEGD